MTYSTLALALSLASASLTAATPEPYSQTEKEDAKKVEQAFQWMAAGQLDKASPVLLTVLANAPRDPSEYVSRFEKNGTLYLKSWSAGDFAYYSALYRKKQKKRVEWAQAAYPRAYFCLGFIRMARGDPKTALGWLDHGLKLEPTNPNLLIEKATIYVNLKQYEKASEIYAELLKMGDEARPEDRAAALRGQGFVLTEAGDLDGAERAFKESLKLDPGSTTARDELRYLEHLRAGGEKTGIEIYENKKEVTPEAQGTGKK